MRSAFGEFQAGTGHKIGNDSRDQDFARSGLRHHSSGRVNRNAADVPASDLDFAGVETRTQWQPDLQGGRAERQSASNGATGSIERRQNAVASILDQNSAMFLDHLLRQLIMAVQQSAS